MFLSQHLSTRSVFQMQTWHDTDNFELFNTAAAAFKRLEDIGCMFSYEQQLSSCTHPLSKLYWSSIEEFTPLPSLAASQPLIMEVQVQEEEGTERYEEKEDPLVTRYRKNAIRRYREKRACRRWNRGVVYESRSHYAKARQRVNGKFVSKNPSLSAECSNVSV